MTEQPIRENLRRDEYVVELKPWKSIHDSIKTPMVTGLGPHDIKESVLEAGFARITAPEILGSPTHVHPFDQWIYLIGADAFSEFDADVEFTLGDEVLQINYPCYIFIHKGVKHCPLNITRVGKPLLFVDASVTQEASVRPETVSDIRRPAYQAITNQEK